MIIIETNKILYNNNRMEILLEKLPMDILKYIYSYRPILRIELWMNKYLDYDFLEKINEWSYFYSDNSDTGKRNIHILFHKYFPHLRLKSVHIERFKKYDRHGKCIGWYDENYTNFNDLNTEIISKMILLEENSKNHYLLYKLHLNYIVLANILERNKNRK